MRKKSQKWSMHVCFAAREAIRKLVLFVSAPFGKIIGD